ncbi:hypothetical protein RCL_jg21092.t1 [Rhizophagus clarus]|uniref:Uncharacterized protein n=1 Tax=Rhizophagus clarus TaxID=94130 RepID=A0A8H3LVZ6_9GLOM|nr:hypothetical protein RCL_jg21092.t1 [Rhizophagus clarus]
MQRLLKHFLIFCTPAHLINKLRNGPESYLHHGDFKIELYKNIIIIISDDSESARAHFPNDIYTNREIQCSNNKKA